MELVLMTGIHQFAASAGREECGVSTFGDQPCTTRTAREHFTIILVEGFSQLTLYCALEAMQIANRLSGERLYQWSLASRNGRSATCSNDAINLVQYDFRNLPRSDRLFVVSGLDVADHISCELLNTLRREKACGTSIGALFSGAHILAKAGFLDGERATIHWDFHESFAEEFPQVELVESLFVADGKYTTASGGAATTDLMLHLISQEHGRALSCAVADQMVYRGDFQLALAHKPSYRTIELQNENLAVAVRRMLETLDNPLPPIELAWEAGISKRHLERLFRQYLKSSPGRYYLKLRLDRARRLLTQTNRAVTEIAMASGFVS
ncbi:MAG: helix-turn-helix domain-containing protein, partial [Armatimonadetes bacterium]|nr:helix-turn-helix domain-containing protein [Armatimonadota bacterium]